MPKALTVRQPFATRIVRGEKTVENRTRNTHLRGSILIHAGQAIHERFAYKALPEIERMPRSAIIGRAQLVDCHRASLRVGGCCQVDTGAEWPADGDTESRVFHWMLEDAVEFVTPIPRIKGALGFWDPEPSALYLAEIADVVERQQP
jgi:hypothetical protein